MSISVYEYDDYKQFLNSYINSSAKKRGLKSLLAQKLRCQKTFVSQVLQGGAHFNLEHADAISEYLGHTNDEANFFMLLVLYSRAATTQLKKRIYKQMVEVREKRNILKNRFKEKEILSHEDLSEYYSSWLYGALRVFLTIPNNQSIEKIEEHFRLTREQISPAIEFLLSRGLIVTNKTGRLEVTEKHMYLGNDSKLISKHHTNWRLKAMQSLDYERKTDLHYSSVNSLSLIDAQKIRELLVKMIEESRHIVKASSEEKVFAFCADIFEV